MPMGKRRPFSYFLFRNLQSCATARCAQSRLIERPLLCQSYAMV